LTRSLADFAKLVELFDQHNVSFVSVTQQFNTTTTSMGRLTLNILLSFAQFEREVTSERIRDKIAASKRKGLWVGGMVPLGYDAKDRKIWVNEEEAERVRIIFRRYLDLGQPRPPHERSAPTRHCYQAPYPENRQDRRRRSVHARRYVVSAAQIASTLGRLHSKVRSCPGSSWPSSIGNSSMQFRSSSENKRTITRRCGRVRTPY